MRALSLDQALSSLRRRTLGSWWRMTLSLLALLAFGAGAWLVYGWWTLWPTRAILRCPGRTWPLAFSPDSRTFATSGTDGIKLWDTADGRQRATWSGLNEGDATAGAFAPDGRTFAAVLYKDSRPLTMALIDVGTGRVNHLLPTPYTRYYGFAFRDGGRSLRAFLGDDLLKEAVTWDVETGQETKRRPLTCPTASCCTAISPDGRLLALSPYIGTVVTIWDLDADRELTKLTDVSTRVPLALGLDFSPDSRTLAVSREDGSFEIWDIAARRLVTAFRGHTSSYRSFGIQIAPDGRTLASRGQYFRPSTLTEGVMLELSRVFMGGNWTPAPEVIVHDIRTGRRLALAPAASFPFYSPDSATIATMATSERDRTIRLRPGPAGPR